jgi:ABC-type nitrate/sulfonate/bicarbonate transport system permease component
MTIVKTAGPEEHTVERQKDLGGWRQTLFAALGLVALMQVLSYFTPAYVLPGWGTIFEAILDLEPAWIIATFLRVAAALVFSFVVGAVLAAGAYSIPVLQRYLLPVIRILMAIPAVCWIIFTILWFQGVEARIFFVLTVSAVPIFMLDVLDGLKSVPKELRDMLRSFRPNSWQYYSKLMLPSILPAIFTSWKVNLSLSIRLVTFAELVGAASGIGFALNQAKALFRIEDVYALTVVLVIWLMAMQAAVILLEKHTLRWRD